MDSSSKLSDFAFGRQATAKYRGYPSNSRLPVTSAKAAKSEEEAPKSQDPLPELDKEATSKEIKEAMDAVGPEIAEHISKEDKKKMKNLLDGKEEGSGTWMSTDKMKEVATSKKGKIGMAVIGLLIVMVVVYKMMSKKSAPDSAPSSTQEQTPTETTRSERVALARAALSATRG